MASATDIRLLTMAGVILCMALSVPCRAERLTRSDFRDLWNITTTSAAKEYRIEFTGDLAYAARLPVEVFDSTDKAMTYRQYGDVTVQVQSASEPLVCEAVDPVERLATKWHCATQSRAFSTIAVSVHVVTNAGSPSLTATVRSGEMTIGALAGELRIGTGPTIAGRQIIGRDSQYGILDSVAEIAERQSLQSVDIEFSAPVWQVSATLASGSSIAEPYLKHVKWRPAKLVSNIGGRIFTFANPYSDLPATAGRLTFATPIDPNMQLASFECKTADCDEYNSDQSRFWPLHGVTSNSPYEFTPIRSPYVLFQFGKPLTNVPTLDLAYTDTGIIFFAQGTPPYTLAVQPKDARFNAYVQGRTAMFPLEQDEHQFDAASVSRYASGSRLVDAATKWFGPILMIVMLIAGFAWASASRRSSAA